MVPPCFGDLTQNQNLISQPIKCIVCEYQRMCAQGPLKERKKGLGGY